MTYKIASLVIQPVIIVEDADGNLSPLPAGQSVPPVTVGIAELVGSPLHTNLIDSLDALNADPEPQPAKPAHNGRVTAKRAKP